jgi:hypothetical protein
MKSNNIFKTEKVVFTDLFYEQDMFATEIYGEGKYLILRGDLFKHNFKELNTKRLHIKINIQ